MTTAYGLAPDARALLGEGLCALAYWQMDGDDLDEATERQDGWTLFGPADAPRYQPILDLAEFFELSNVQLAPKLEEPTQVSGPPSRDELREQDWRTRRAELLAAAHSVQHLDAGHDVNGNPRRAWLVYDESGTILDAIDEEYGGKPEALRELVELAELPVPVATWRSFLADHATRLVP